MRHMLIPTPMTYPLDRRGGRAQNGNPSPPPVKVLPPLTYPSGVQSMKRQPTSHTYPIVGARHHPPAQALLKVLPIGAPLTLHAEPDNPYDPNAIAVWLDAQDIPLGAMPRLEEELSTYGHDTESVVAQGMWHVGYIPRETAAFLREAGFPADSDVAAEFTCSNGGAPFVRFTMGEG